MNTDIIVAVIGLLGVVISVIVSAKTTQNKVSEELKTQNAVQNEKIDQLGKSITSTKDDLTAKMNAQNEVISLKLEHLTAEQENMKRDIQSHNHYAQLFSETVPVVQERQNVANKRIDDLERDVKELRTYHIAESSRKHEEH